MSTFQLRHKRYPVMDMDLTITPHGFTVNAITKIYNRDLLPFPLINVPRDLMPYQFKNWFKLRMIPKERIGINNTIASMAKTKNINDIDLYGMLEIMALLSYGRNLTDKYWIMPKKPYTINTGNKICGLNGLELDPKRTYKGLDFHKNGIAQNFSHVIRKDNSEIRENVDYNVPDFCTNGIVKKCISKDEYGFWLEKYMTHLSMEDFKNFSKQMIIAQQTMPDIFPQIQFITDENNKPIGYRSRIFTKTYSELVTLQDLALASNKASEKNYNISEEKVYETCEEYGLNKEKIENFIKDIKIFIPEEKIFENSGLIIDAESKDLIKFAAWL